MTGTEVEAIATPRRGRARALRRRPRAHRRAASRRRPAEGLHRRRRRGRARPRSCAARRTSPPARRSPSRGPARSCPAAIKLEDGQAARRQVSEGMILAEDELEIGADHAGIMVLEPDGLRPGQPLEEVLPLATEVLDLEVTPNRPDCLGLYGVAREVHAATGAPLSEPPWATDPGSADGDLPVTVEVQSPDLCPRFTARVFEDVTIGPSPLWLKARLSAAGQRPINNVVDITNYVMLLTGQPLHAFDLDRVAGGRLVVRRAQEGEQVVTLDDQVRTLGPAECLIADDEGPTSIAGIMGGDRSEVSETTTRVLLEVANWHGPSINATSNKLVLRTEASSRYEKGLAPEQTMDAQAVASALLVEHAGARLLPGTIDVGGHRTGARGPAAARGARRAAPRHPDPARGAVRAPAGARLRRGRRGRRARRDGAVLAPRGRHPRGRSRGGDRAPARRQREPPRDAAVAQGRDRRAHAGPADPAARGGRPRRPRPLRDRGLELRRARAARPPAHPAGQRPPGRRRGGEPDERGAGHPAPDDPRLAAGRRGREHGPRPPRPRPVRVRRRLPRERRRSRPTSTTRSPR